MSSRLTAEVLGDVAEQVKHQLEAQVGSRQVAVFIVSIEEDKIAGGTSGAEMTTPEAAATYTALYDFAEGLRTQSPDLVHFLDETKFPDLRAKARN